ncbi:hypothetical protein CBP27_06725 [Fischerella thermalis WC542]|nr:hypothetical protein CBP17_20955 [Fischerella thermalis WC114]PLZ12509.1 hypothetical protein CBP18_06500 [Fischerella thermalis WC119]PLZ18958.1 hypothetical protein CBP30_15400 [Fischerella thermalis WC157]PLZ20770.1 hypothetical protein CBP29_16300 [Fischerella thermalis WC341]PLZ32701.1 hypothetical protein CBP28_04770 [Fischerella thermalis WC559]PLZ34318.1 hypothetical protein CBP10_06290 [Fischerella thermalis WC558]PLZ40555.1 hypothetical protein CBP27_06725 [Fischerella thermalis 
MPQHTPCPLPKYPSFHNNKSRQQNQNKRDTTKITKLANDTDTIATEERATTDKILIIDAVIIIGIVTTDGITIDLIIKEFITIIREYATAESIVTASIFRNKTITTVDTTIIGNW